MKHVVLITTSGMNVHFDFEGTVSVYTCCPTILSASSPFNSKNATVIWSQCSFHYTVLFLWGFVRNFWSCSWRSVISVLLLSQLGCFYYLHMVTHNYSSSPFKVDLRKFGVVFATCLITNSKVCIFMLISFFCFSFLFFSCSFFSSPISHLYLEFYASLAAILNYFWDMAMNKEAQNKQIASRTYLIFLNDWKTALFYHECLMFSIFYLFLWSRMFWIDGQILI